MQVLQLFLESQPIIRFYLDHFFHESSIFVIFIDCIHFLCNRSVAVFAHSYTYYSLLPGKTHSSCVSPQICLFLFCRLQKILCKLGDFVGSSHLISFKQSSSIWSGSFSPHLAHVCHPPHVSLWCPYFWHLKHLCGAWTYCSTISTQ